MEITTEDAQRIGRSLNAHYTLGEITFFPMQLGEMSDEKAQEIIDKIPKNLLPDDYAPNQNRALIRLIGLCFFLKSKS